MAGGGAPAKSDEPQPHPPKDQLPNISYCITSPPPWREYFTLIQKCRKIITMLLEIKNCFFSVSRLRILFFERKLVNLTVVVEAQEKELPFLLWGI